MLNKIINYAVGAELIVVVACITTTASSITYLVGSTRHQDKKEKGAEIAAEIAKLTAQLRVGTEQIEARLKSLEKDKTEKASRWRLGWW
jgi:hypothetical protein